MTGMTDTFSCRNSKEYKRIEQAIRRLTLSSLEDELIFLRRYLKDNGLLTRDLQNYNRVTRSIRSLKRQIDPLFYYQKSLKKLVIKERKLEFQFEMLKEEKDILIYSRKEKSDFIKNKKITYHIYAVKKINGIYYEIRNGEHGDSKKVLDFMYHSIQSFHP